MKTKPSTLSFLPKPKHTATLQDLYNVAHKVLYGEKL